MAVSALQRRNADAGRHGESQSRSDREIHLEGLAPKPLEPPRRDARAAGRVLRIVMTQIILNKPHVGNLNPVGQVITAAMPEHVSVHIAKPGPLRRLGDGIVARLACHGLARPETNSRLQATSFGLLSATWRPLKIARSGCSTESEPFSRRTQMRHCFRFRSFLSIAVASETRSPCRNIIIKRRWSRTPCLLFLAAARSRSISTSVR